MTVAFFFLRYFHLHFYFLHFYCIGSQVLLKAHFSFSKTKPGKASIQKHEGAEIV